MIYFSRLLSHVLLGDAKLASKFSELMLNEVIYVIGFSYPVVPKRFYFKIQI